MSWFGLVDVAVASVAADNANVLSNGNSNNSNDNDQSKNTGTGMGVDTMGSVRLLC